VLLDDPARRGSGLTRAAPRRNYMRPSPDSWMQALHLFFKMVSGSRNGRGGRSLPGSKRRIGNVDPFNLNVTLMHKTLEIERATRDARIMHAGWWKATDPPPLREERPSLWQQLLALFHVRSVQEATID
jgi:hypothetical protein